MEAFIETLNDKRFQTRLIQALERKRPFANFKSIIDSSDVRQNWFDFRDERKNKFASFRFYCWMIGGNVSISQFFKAINILYGQGDKK